ILDRVRVDYYGASVPINQVATVNIPEPRLIVISPWDKSQLPNIERAIQKADLGLSPSSDGQVIRLAIPQLTAERREALVRSVRATAESARVAIRNVRRDANDMIKELSRDGDVTEDEARHGQEEVQKLTDRFVAEVGRVLAEKEAEITEV
ncbi:MAG: ribosome recycling factor, partial [Dactylosporangium sp.]|nr:ribosome recycling factor [Dactylosporangium sp.]